MLIRVLQRLGCNGDRILAESRLGVFHCSYDGPELGVDDTFYAEISIAKRAVYGENFFVSDVDEEAICEDSGNVRFYCSIETVDDDGVITLRIDDTLFLLEYVGEYFPSGTRCALTVSNELITLYNIGL
jgi:hypothetical protein